MPPGRISVYPDAYADSNTCRVAMFLMYSDEATPDLAPLTYRELFQEPLWKVTEFELKRLPHTQDATDPSAPKRPCVSPAKKERLQEIYGQFESDLKSLGTTLQTCCETDTGNLPAPVQGFASELAAVGLWFPPNHIDPSNRSAIQDLFSATGKNFLDTPLLEGGTPLIGDVSHDETCWKYSLTGGEDVRITKPAYQALRVARKTGVLLRFVELPDLCA